MIKKYEKNIIIFTVILALLCGTTALAENPKGQPFKAIWEAIVDLQEQINNLVLQPGPQGPMGPQGPVGPVGQKGENGNTGEPGTPGIQLRVVDGSNQDLGILIDAQIQTNYFVTYNESLGAIMRFYNDITHGSENNPTKFVPNITTIHFDQPNCIGTPFAGIDNRSPQGVFTMDDLRTLPLYMFTGDETPTIKMSMSRSNTPSDPCRNFTNPVPVEYAVTLQEITLPFIEPLTWPLTIDRL